MYNSMFCGVYVSSFICFFFWGIIIFVLSKCEGTTDWSFLETITKAKLKKKQKKTKTKQNKTKQKFKIKKNKNFINYTLKT
jgi:hypothetical protein